MSRELARDVVPLPDGMVCEISTIRILTGADGGFEIGVCIFTDEWAYVQGRDPHRCQVVCIHPDEASALSCHADVLDRIRIDRRWPS